MVAMDSSGRPLFFLWGRAGWSPEPPYSRLMLSTLLVALRLFHSMTLLLCHSLALPFCPLLLYLLYCFLSLSLSHALPLCISISLHLYLSSSCSVGFAGNCILEMLDPCIPCVVCLTGSIAAACCNPAQPLCMQAGTYYPLFARSCNCGRVFHRRINFWGPGMPHFTSAGAGFFYHSVDQEHLPYPLTHL